MKRKIFYALVGLALAAIVMSTGSMTSTVSASTAKASMVTGCSRGACIDAYTGGKNYSNHTQWLDTVEVYYGGGVNRIEAWGDGFYRQTNSVSARWYIGRWVHSGTYVCGAITYGTYRAIACIAIRV